MQETPHKKSDHPASRHRIKNYDFPGLPATLLLFYKDTYQDYLRRFNELHSDPFSVIFENQIGLITKEDFLKTKTMLEIHMRRGGLGREPEKSMSLITKLMLNPYQCYTFVDYLSNYEIESQSFFFSVSKYPKLTIPEFMQAKKQLLLILKDKKTYFPTEEEGLLLSQLFAGTVPELWRTAVHTSKVYKADEP